MAFSPVTLALADAVRKWLGLLMFHTLKRRRYICCVNLELAFPELSQDEQRELNRQHFISLGQGLLETAMSWWGSEKRLQKLVSYEGLDYLHQANTDSGVVLLSAHFTSLELGGRLLAPHLPLHVVYRPHQNALIESQVAKLRAHRYGKAISRDNIRAMLQSLKQGNVVWYAQDQHFDRKNSLFVPFLAYLPPRIPPPHEFLTLAKQKCYPFSQYVSNRVTCYAFYPSGKLSR